MVQALRSTDPEVIGPYRLLGQLGGGGMGRVFLGLSAGGRLVAVKIIRSELAVDPEFRSRFRQEVAAARKVSGLFTAAVVDADVDGPAPWLATAYVAGPSLAQAVSDHGSLPSAAVLALAAGLAESLAAIHAAGVVHRDLKPSNVLLAQDGPRLIDFGISRAIEATSLTRAGLVLGSPGFMSPEQAEGSDVGPPSDMFSLGAVLTFAATGEGPFGDGSAPALAYRVVHAQANLDRLPAEVRSLAERCLAKDPNERLTAADLLAEAGSGQPAPGWIPESIIRAFTQDPVLNTAVSPPAKSRAQDDPTPAAAGDAALTLTARKMPASPKLAASHPPPGHRDQPTRRHLRRPVILASVAGALVAASAAAGFALGNTHQVPSARSSSNRGAAATGSPAISASATALAPVSPQSPSATVTTPEPGPSQQCIFYNPGPSSCVSSDHEVVVYGHWYSSTAACTFSFQLNWDDGTAVQTFPVMGGPEGQFVLGRHLYGTAGTYAINYTASVTSGSCWVTGGSWLVTIT